jgi:hypothetical protein
MKWTKASPQQAGLPEVVFNLWWFRDDESGFVLRLAGRAYALVGSDEEKLKVIHSLSATDFHVARVFPIPQRFQVVSEHGTLKGVTTQDIVRLHHADLFEHIFAALGEDLPMQVRSIGGEYQQYRLQVPRDPLCVTTCVVEHADGTLTPLISKRA